MTMPVLKSNYSPGQTTATRTHRIQRRKPASILYVFGGYNSFMPMPACPTNRASGLVDGQGSLNSGCLRQNSCKSPTMGLLSHK